MLWWFAQDTLTATLLTVMVALICRIGRPNPAVRHALWLVILLKLLTPPVFSWPWTVSDFWLPVLASRSQEESAVEPSAAARVVEDLEPWAEELATWDGLAEESDARDIPVPSERVADGNLSASKPQVQKERGSPRPKAITNRLRLTWPERKHLGVLLLALWLAGVAMVIFRQLCCILRCHRICATGRPAPDWLDQEVTRLSPVLRVRPPATLAVIGIRSPFVWCLGRPKLLWPASLTADLDPEQWRGVIAHELAHLKRRDHWVAWLELVAGCIWWWSPIFWCVRRQLRESAEWACDAWVVWALPEGRRAYAEALVEVSQVVSQTRTPVPVLGVSSGARETFQRRLVMILCERVPCKVSLVGLLGVGVLALVALPAWSLGQPAQETSRPAASDPVAAVSEAVAVSAEGAATSEPVIVSVQATTAPAVSARPAPATDTRPAAQSAPALRNNEPAAAAPTVNVAFAQDSPESKLSELESKLEALIAEVRALRSGGPAAAWSTRRAPVPDSQETTTSVQQVPRVPATTTSASRTVLSRAAASAGVQTLTRATYQLPQATAEALASFLREHVKADVETRVDGDKIIVTTTSDAQTTIGQFISLIQGKTSLTLNIINRKPSLTLERRSTSEPARLPAPSDNQRN